MVLVSVLYAEVYFICMIVVGLLLFWSLRSDSRSSSEQWQIRMLGGFLVCYSANLLFALVQGLFVGEPWGVGALYALKSLYFLTFIISTYLWCCYAEMEQRTDKRFGKLIGLPFFVPFLAPAALVILNLWTHSLFEIDAAGLYHRHGMYHWLMAYMILCTALSSGRHFRHSFRESDPVRRSYLLLAASFPLTLFVAWLLSLASEQVPVVCVCITLDLMCLYVGTTRQQISLDKLTQVNNRHNLISFMKYKLAAHSNRLYLLMIDVDDFKQINDAFGHLEGDSALILVAQSLKKACAPYKLRPYIARYGGDEFMVVMEGTQAEAEKLCEDIQRIVREKQDGAAPYEVKVSIGLAGSSGAMIPNDLILAADEELYRIKKERKAGRSAAREQESL